MYKELKGIIENSYSKYSNYKVACIVKMKDGAFFKGVNVENASYGATICAERSAILSAISNGYHKGEFKELYVMVSSGDIGTPCFLCRQVISELFPKEALIHCVSTTGEEKVYTKDELCPYPFGEEDLK